MLRSLVNAVMNLGLPQNATISRLVKDPLVSREGLYSMELVGYSQKTPFQATRIHTIHPYPLSLIAIFSATVDIPEVRSCLEIY